MAETIIDLGGEMDTLQRQTRTAQKALSGLEKQLQSMGQAMGSLMESISPAEILEQTQKVVKRTTTTVRREKKRALADFDKLNRLETDNTTTTVTTSVTTTTQSGALAEDTEKLSKTDLAPLIAMFGTLQTAIASASLALQAQMLKALEEIGQAVNRIVPGWMTAIIAAADSCWLRIMGIFAPAPTWFATLCAQVARLVTELISGVDTGASGCWEKIRAAWGGAAAWFMSAVTAPVGADWSALLGNISQGAGRAWSGVTGALAGAAVWLEGNVVRPAAEALRGALTGIFDWAESIWNKLRTVFGNLGSFFKELLNGVIGALNSAISGVFGGINSIIGSLKKIRILGTEPLGGLSTIAVPRIPYLAQGAVLPANRPFLAMVGDQRHGTNVEAPLATIQEAVAAVMEDLAASNLAGQEAVVSVLRQILEAVLGISLSDRTLYEAVDRHRRDMAVVHGGGQLWY